MKTKFKYLILTLFLILFTTIILTSPHLYFLIDDQKKYQTYQINTLNLRNVYENIELSNEQKLEILEKGDTKEFVIQENIDEEEYNKIMNMITEELTKISNAAAKIFQENLQINYSELLDLEANRIYISNNNTDTISINYISFISMETEISIVLDSYDHTILYLSGTTQVSSFEKETEENDLQEAYTNYLKIKPQNFLVDAYFTPFEIILQATSQKNNTIVESSQTKKNLQ